MMHVLIGRWGEIEKPIRVIVMISSI